MKNFTNIFRFFFFKRNMNGIQALFTWVICFGLLNFVMPLENGLARTPPMGWMSWGYYRCGVSCLANPKKCLNEKLILSVADAIYNNGYQEAGYEYIVIDDCWSERSRGKDGRLVPDRKRFPHGMKYIADYIHARGLKFGMYTNVGEETCEHYPGSRNHFIIDTMTFAEWHVDYLKLDGCYVKEAYINTAFIKFGRNLNDTDRPMVYSCSWPYYIEFFAGKKPDFEAVSTHCNMWRVYHDIAPSWKSVKATIRHFEDHFGEMFPYHGPGQWNDPDMLIFGTGALTESQSRVHLVVWVMLSAPLLMSCDMNLLTDYEKKLLQNLDLIAIDQDPLGIMAEPLHVGNHTTLWVKRHYPKKGDKYHSVSFALVNLTTKKDQVSITPSGFDLKSLDGYTVLDVLSGVYIRNITISDTINVTVPPEDVILYTMYAL